MKFKDRAPHYNQNYKSQAEYVAALEQTDSVSKAVQDHVSSLKLPERAPAETFFQALDTKEKLGEVSGLHWRKAAAAYLSGLDTKIVHSVEGRLEHVLLTVPWIFSEITERYYVDPLLERHYKSLIAALGTDREYTVVCHPHSADRVEKWFDVKPHIVLSPRFEYSEWAQDAYIALTDNYGNQMLVEGICFNRYDDMTIADDVARQTNVGAMLSELYFQGGNILGGLSTTMIGMDYIWKNETRVGFETREKVIAAFQDLLGTDILILGGNLLEERYRNDLNGAGMRQPIFHIDMYVTPTGVRANSGKEIVLLGRPCAAEKATGYYSDDPYYNNEQLDDLFEETAEQLKTQYEVYDLPLYLAWGNLGYQNDTRRHYYLTFNNVVIENYGTPDGPVRNVYMPTYSPDSAIYRTDAAIRQDLEAAAESVWTELGFTVHRLDGMEDMAFASGSVHCMTKALRRGSTGLG